MSNPGVWTLSQKHIGFNKEFSVEDNFAESVHFHYNDIRIDLSIEELEYLAREAEIAICKLVNVKEFELADFDDDFLNLISSYLVDLESVEKKTVKADDLYYLAKNKLKLPIRRKIRSDIIIEKRGDGHLPVLFNKDNTVVYGYSQVGEAISRGEKEIVVLVLHFKDGKHTPPKKPWIPYLFKWNRERILKLARTVAIKLMG